MCHFASLIELLKERNVKWTQRCTVTSNQKSTGRKAFHSILAALQEVGRGCLSVDLKHTGTINGAESAGGGGRHGSLRGRCSS